MNKTISLASEKYIGKTISLGAPVFTKNIVYHTENKLEDIVVADKTITKEQISVEIGKYKKAKCSLEEELKKIINNDEISKNQKGFYEFLLSLLNDRRFAEGSIHKRLEAEKKPVEIIVKKLIFEIEKMFKEIPNDYMKARAPDIISFGKLLLKHLDSIKNAGQDLEYKIKDLKECVVVTNEFSAHYTHLLTVNGKIKAIVSEWNTFNQHPIIIARDAEIAVITNVNKAEIDGAKNLFINPQDSSITKDVSPQKQMRCEVIIREYQQKELVRNRVLNKRATFLDKDSQGEKKEFELFANLSGREGIDSKYSNYIGGIGLTRSEMFYHQSPVEPNYSVQVEDYGNILGKFNHAVIRMFDLAPDKQLKFFSGEGRGLDLIRNNKENYQIYLNQISAIIKAAAIKNVSSVSVLVPMVKSVEDLDFFSIIVDQSIELLRREGTEFSSDKVKVGAMIENPEAYDNLEEIVQRAAFTSLGTNDTDHYIFHEERFGSKPQEQDDQLYVHDFNPFKFLLYDYSLQVAQKYDKEMSVCGGLAENPDWAYTFMGMGARYVSVPMSTFPDIKLKLRSVYIKKYNEYIQALYNLPEVKELFKQTAKIKDFKKVGASQYKKTLAYLQKIPYLSNGDRLLHNNLLLEATNAIEHEMNTNLRMWIEQEE